MRSVVTLVLAAACCFGVAACSSPAPEPDPSRPAASPSATATPTPTAAPDGIVETSDPALGIVFDDATGLTGEEADVHDWIATFEKEYWRSLTTNTLSPAFDLIASPEVKARMQTMVSTNVEDQSVVDGVLHVQIGPITLQDGTATASVCRDFSEVTVVEAGRALSLEEAGLAEPDHKAMTLLQVPADQRWIVQTSQTDGTC